MNRYYLGERLPMNVEEQRKFWRLRNKKRISLLPIGKCSVCGRTRKIFHKKHVLCALCVDKKSTYRLTIDQLRKIYEGKICIYCKTDLTKVSMSTWQIDHNHETGKVYGMCCINCNRTVAYYEHNPEAYMKIIIIRTWQHEIPKTQEEKWIPEIL